MPWPPRADRGRPLVPLLALLAFTSIPALPARSQEDPARGQRPPSGLTPDLPDEEFTEIPLGLEEVIAIALEYNLDLRVEYLNRDNALQDIAVTVAAFDPVFTTGFTYNRFREATASFLSGVNTGLGIAVNPFDSQVFNAGITGLLPIGTLYELRVDHTRANNPDSTFFTLNPRYSPSASIEVTQPLLRNFGTDANFADYRIASYNQEISLHQLRRLIETTLAEVVNAYWDVVFAREDLQVKLEALTEAEQLLEINRQRVQVGTATQIDVYDAEANIETQKSGIIEARAELLRIQDVLLDLLNYPEVLKDEQQTPDVESGVYASIRIVPTTPLSTEEVQISQLEAVRMALENRADLREAEIAITNAGIELQRREDQWLPALDLRGSWTQEGLEDVFNDAVDELTSGRYYSWTLGLVFEIPIGNRAERALRAQARNSLRAAQLNQQRTRNAILMEVRQAVRDLDTTYQRITTTAATVRLRSEQLEGEKQRLRVGSSTSYQVLQIQNDLLEARTEEVRARVDHMKAITSFRSAVGTVLQRLGVQVD